MIKRKAVTGLVALPAMLAVLAGGAWVLTDNSRTPEAPAFTIEHALPAAPLLHVSIDGREAKTKCRELALGKFWNDPQVKQFLAPVMPMVEGMLGEAEKELTNNTGMTFDDILAVLSGHVTMTVTDFAMTDTGSPDVDAVMTMELSGANKETLAKLAAMAEGAMRDGMGMEPAQVDVAGVSALQVDMGGDGPVITWARFGNYMIAGTNQATLAGVVNRLKARSPAGGLMSDPGFSKTARKVAPSGKPMLMAYANLESVLGLDIIDMVADEEPMVGTVIDMLSLDDLTGAGYAMCMEGKGIADRFHIGRKRNAKGIWSIYRHRSSELVGLDVAPENSFYFAGWAVTPEQVDEALTAVEKWGRVFAEEFGEDVFGEITGFVAEIEKRLGFSLRKDLLPKFGDEAAMWVAPSPFGGLFPEIVLAIGVKEPAAVQGYIDRAARAYDADGLVRNFDFNGKRMTYFQVGDLIPQGRAPVGFGLKPTWMFDGKFLMVALAPQTLKHRVLAKRHQQPTMRVNRDFQDIMAHMRRYNPEFGKDNVGYFDFGGATTFVVDTVAPIVQSIRPPEEVPLDLALFPTSDVFHRHLFGMVSGNTYAQDGMLTEMYTPTGIVAPIGAAVGAVGLFFANRFENAEAFDGGFDIEELQEDK